MWTDHYLKFNTEDAYLAAMPAALQEACSPLHATDVIGTLYHAETHAPLSGFHVNLRLADGLALPESLEAHALPTPALPKRVFA